MNSQLIDKEARLKDLRANRDAAREAYQKTLTVCTAALDAKMAAYNAYAGLQVEIEMLSGGNTTPPKEIA